MNTALYTSEDIEYAQFMSGPYEDLSVRDGLTAIAGVKDGRVSGFWRPMVVCGDYKKQKEFIKNLWESYQDIYYMDYVVDGISPVTQFLLSKGYKSTPCYTQVIDLTETEEYLHANLRKSYKSLCNEDCHIENNFDKIRKIAEKHKGKVRHKKAWKLQSKISHVAFANKDSYAMFYFDGDWAYYASAAGQCHAMVWNGIKYLKRLGAKKLEMGEQVFDDSKEGNISKFKRGFGGRCELRLILEKD